MSTQDASAETEDAQTEPSTGSAHQDRRMREKRERQDERDKQAQADAEAAADEEAVQLKVFRYDPEVEGKQEPRFDDFHVPFEKGMTVLDALIYARDHFDSSLTFRHSCRQAVCGSDALDRKSVV